MSKCTTEAHGRKFELVDHGAAVWARELPDGEWRETVSSGLYLASWYIQEHGEPEWKP